jgi:ribosomal protein S27AE
MLSKQKINLEKVKASLNTLCPKCGYSIPPEKLYRVDSDHVKCPECGERFIPGSGNVRQ